VDDELIEEGGLTRRSALKRIGVGAAIAWSAPVVMSMGSKAYGAPAGSVPPCPPFPSDQACANHDLSGLLGCNGQDPSVCYQSCSPNGNQVCAQRLNCNNTNCGPQGTNGVCGAGEVCARTCCPDFGGGAKFQCFPKCP
jgi:hypothetical protein